MYFHDAKGLAPVKVLTDLVADEVLSHVSQKMPTLLQPHMIERLRDLPTALFIRRKFLLTKAIDLIESSKPLPYSHNTEDWESSILSFWLVAVISNSLGFCCGCYFVLGLFVFILFFCLFLSNEKTQRYLSEIMLRFR